MSKRAFKGIFVAGLLLVVLVGAIAVADFQPAYDEPQSIPTFTTAHDPELNIYDEDGNLKENSLPFAIFEQFGFVLIPLAVLMFGAMVGGVVISREEVEE
ncbi:MAG: hypothetical protein J5813_00400 [Candidatus Methanomethylophilaceae archaeon]|nr:hypothetical protein [Candidatus Methanomethylophilaceae archaeon]